MTEYLTQLGLVARAFALFGGAAVCLVLTCAGIAYALFDLQHGNTRSALRWALFAVVALVALTALATGITVVYR